MFLLKLLGLGKWLKEALGRLLSAAARYPWQTALIAALCFSAWLWRGWSHADATIAKRDATIAEITEAQKQAKAAQDKADQGNVGVQKPRNEQVTNDTPRLEAARRDAVADYVRNHPVRVCGQAGSAPSGTDAASVHPDPEGIAGGEAAPGMATISLDDLDKLSAGALQGARCTGFLNALVTEKLAVPVE